MPDPAFCGGGGVASHEALGAKRRRDTRTRDRVPPGAPNRVVASERYLTLLSGLKLPRAVSSVGRALHSHCRGHRFDSGTVHQTIF